MGQYGAYDCPERDRRQERRFLTIEQVAEELNVGQQFVRALLRSGELRGLQIGGRGVWRVGTQDLEDYISQAYETTASMIAAGEISDEGLPAD